MNKKNELLKELIGKGLFDQAIDVVRTATDYREAELFISVVLEEEKSTPELLEVAFQTFFDGQENYRPNHGYWVHSLSHFTSQLWERQMYEWIKKFYGLAFKGANELRDSNCLDRLVSDFGYYARWNDDPVEFHLTPENLSQIDWEYCEEMTKKRIEMGRFGSEEVFLYWKLRQIKEQITIPRQHNIMQMGLHFAKKIRSLVTRLRDLEADISEFDSLERDLLAQLLVKAEERLATSTQDWDRKSLEKSIQKIHEAQASL